MAFASLVVLGLGVAKLVDAREAAEIVAEARNAAQTDQNARSAQLFAQALDQDPGLRPRILREYADQVLYSGGAAEAIPLFQESLTKTPLSEAEADQARRNLALAYLWAGEYAKAVKAYEDALRHLPGDADLTRNYIDALVGAARDAARHDRNRESAEMYSSAIETAPERRAELLREYADQLTYSGRAAVAVDLYREIIAGQFGSEINDLRLHSALGLALLWSDQPAAARMVFERLLEIAPQDIEVRERLAESLVSLARREASIDRNAEAAALFERALTLAPGKRAEWLKEFADQLTYAQRAPEAIERYSEMLHDFPLSSEARTDVRLSLALAQSWSGALHEALTEYEALIADDPGNLRARTGRAEILSWMERHDSAASELRAVLAARPDDLDARRRLARSESYRGRYREAVKLAQPLLAADPADEEAAVIIAESQLWMGRPDSARQTVDTLLSVRPDSARALELRKELIDDNRPLTSIRASGSTQSDDLYIWRAGLKQAFTLNDGRTVVGPQFEHVGYNPEHGPSVNVERVGAFVHHRFSDAIELNSSFYADFQHGDSDTTIFTHDTYLTLFPGDRWRVDLGANRYTLDNITSLNKGISVDSFSGSVDFWPASYVKLTGRGAWSDYSDGNERWWFQGEGQVRFMRGPDIWFGARYTALAFSEMLDNGYFNPDDLYSFETTAQASGDLKGGASYELRGSLGYEDADPASNKMIWSAGVKVSYPVTDLVAVEALAGHSSSTLSSDSGFSRTTVGLGLNVRW